VPIVTGYVIVVRGSEVRIGRSPTFPPGDHRVPDTEPGPPVEGDPEAQHVEKQED
jgi:hypothetical protein